MKPHNPTSTFSSGSFGTKIAMVPTGCTQKIMKNSFLINLGISNYKIDKKIRVNLSWLSFPHYAIFSRIFTHIGTCDGTCGIDKCK